jgi:transcription initiation factor TFIIIB Brf1 subunit/transcription initiation factor TFIIB
MATYNELKFDPYKPPQNFSLDECDVCGSNDIIEVREGYVCRNCGVVLEIQRLEYHTPYDATQLQHAVLSKTQIGFWKERRVMSDSIHMEYLSRLDGVREREETIKQTTLIEIKRILTGLQLPLNDWSVILKKVLAIRKLLGRGTKYRAPEKLVPCVIYFYYKNNNKPIREAKLLELISLTKKEFNNFKLQMLELWPDYQERNRQEYISQRILALCEHFGLDLGFYHQSKKILYRLYNSIKNTKDDVIVGLVSSITLLCSNNKDIKVSSICERLNIKMSTIHTQVKRRIFNQFHVNGYISLIRSKDVLKRIMIKLDLIDPHLIELEPLDEQEDGAEELYRFIALGSAQPVFSYNEDKLYNLNVVKYASEQELFITLVIKPLQNMFSWLDQKIKKQNKKQAVTIELWKFKYPTGPPLVMA